MRRKDMLLNDIDNNLSELVHISKIKELNVNFEKFKNNDVQNNYLEAQTERAKKYIICPDFNIKTEVKTSHSIGIGNCYYPISYERSFGTFLNLEQLEKNHTNNFLGVKLTYLKVNPTYFKTHCSTFNINYDEFINIYNGLLSYLQYEEHSNILTKDDLLFAFKDSLEMYYLNNADLNNDLKSIIYNGVDYTSFNSFIEECKKNKIIIQKKNLIINKKMNESWTTQNTFLDNRAKKSGKVLTLKEQRKI